MGMGQWLAIIASICLLVHGAVHGQAVSDPFALEQAIVRALDANDNERAAGLLEEYLQQRPNDAQMLYNLACVHCRLGRSDRATGALYRAVEHGFCNFEYMKRDPDLESIRDTEMYRAILEAAERVAGTGAEEAIRRWKETYGTEGYLFRVDKERRLVFAAALDETSFAEMCRTLAREADHLTETLFGAPPDYYVLIAVPAPVHARAIFNDDAIGGRYDHGLRRLVARNIGGSLRHEFVHALHYGHMERLGISRAHPIWIQEGLATLYEDYELDESGSVVFRPNERTNIVKRLAKSGRLTKWEELFTMSAERFMRRPGKMYPQARSILRFLAARGKLAAWYRAYVDHFPSDESGMRAFELVFAKPAEEVEGEWRQWAAGQAAVDLTIDSGDAALGIVSVENASNTGVLIERVLPASGASRGGLRAGDVIVALNGRETRSLRELQSVIGSLRVGDRVEVRAVRRGEYFIATVVLRPLRHPIR